MRNLFFRKTLFLSAAMASLLLSQQGFSQNAELMINAGPCVVLQTAVERFACYENQVEMALSGTGNNTAQARPRPAPEPAPVVVAPAPAAAPASPPTGNTASPEPATRQANPATVPANVAEDDFGFPEDSRQDQKAREVLSVISGLRETVPNQYIFTLENGQVWRQVRPESRLHPRVGHHVRIYPTRFGDDYRLSVDELKLFVQVERVE